MIDDNDYGAISGINEGQESPKYLEKSYTRAAL
jgi:hypothetical protein